MKDPFTMKRVVVPYKTHELPSRAAWKIPVQIPRSEVALLCERLHSIVMDRNGASFFYPNDSRTETICRYEWHHRIGPDRFALRVGIVFLVSAADLSELEIYATTSAAIQDLVTPTEALTDAHAEIAHRDAVDTIQFALRGAKEEKPWLFVFHLVPPYGHGFSSRVTFGEGNFTILPTRILKDLKRVSAVIVRAEAAAKVSARDTAFAKLTTACALFTLSEGQRYEVAKLDSYWSRPTIELVRSIETIREDRLYPLRRKWPKMEELDDLVPDRLSWAWSAFHDLTPEAAEAFAIPLFAYYGATIGARDLATLSVVGYIAALSALRGTRAKCEGDITCSRCGNLSWKHDLKGEVDEIVSALHDLGIPELEKVRTMLLRAYRRQRSSFVHGARHRHREYGQGPNIPGGLPASNSVVQESLVYGEDLQSLAALTRSALLHSLANLAGRTLDRELFKPQHLMQSSESLSFGMLRLVEIRMITSTTGSDRRGLLQCEPPVSMARHTPD